MVPSKYCFCPEVRMLFLPSLHSPESDFRWFLQVLHGLPCWLYFSYFFLPFFMVSRSKNNLFVVLYFNV
jgi:hypothetical protein